VYRYKPSSQNNSLLLKTQSHLVQTAVVLSSGSVQSLHTYPLVSLLYRPNLELEGRRLKVTYVRGDLDIEGKLEVLMMKKMIR